MDNCEIKDDFFIVAYEAGAGKTPVPTWACKRENPLALDPDVGKAVQRVGVESVPGAFQLKRLPRPVQPNDLSDLSKRRLHRRRNGLLYRQKRPLQTRQKVRRCQNCRDKDARRRCALFSARLAPPPCTACTVRNLCFREPSTLSAPIFSLNADGLHSSYLNKKLKIPVNPCIGL